MFIAGRSKKSIIHYRRTSGLIGIGVMEWRGMEAREGLCVFLCFFVFGFKIGLENPVAEEAAKGPNGRKGT
jgi:energy-converting hydrogenase Eha subunit G